MSAKKDDDNKDRSEELPDDGQSSVSDGGDDDGDSEIAKLRQQLDAANKRIDDTFRAYQDGQEKLGKLHRDLEEQARAAAKPALLNETEGLQEAIRYVTAMDANRPTAQDLWIMDVSKALPEVDEWMKNDEYRKAVHEERAKLGDSSWHDPLVAIQVLSRLRETAVRREAIEGDRKARGRSETKAHVMDIPGGGGKGEPGLSTEDEAERIRGMSSDEFRKMRNKVLGYPS